MKAKITLLLCFLSTVVSSQIVTIPDANFKAYLVGNSAINTNGDNEIQVTEAEAFTGTISCQNSGISSLTGIETFINLTQLFCGNNSLTSLNVTQNTALTHFTCNNNTLTSLDVTQNTALTYFRCDDNTLTNLDVTQNTALTYLKCNNNNLNNLDITQNTALTFLNCKSNTLSNLDITQNTALKTLYCNSNSLTNLNVTQNTDLTSLNCKSNTLSNLDVTQNTALNVLNCSVNSLTDLDVTQNVALTLLYCDNNNTLTSLDVTKNIALEYLHCNNNSLANLDVTKNTALKRLWCNHNSIDSLDVTQNTALTDLFSHNNQLTELDIALNSNLTKLTCYANQLTALNVANGNNANMTQMSAQSNPNLNCIQHDTNFDPTTSNTWSKGASASWSDDCNIPEFTITPTSKDYGNLLVNQTLNQTFTITNNGTAPLIISSFALSGVNTSEFSHNGANNTTIAENTSQDITVTFAPTSIGNKEAVLTITDNSLTNPHTVALNGVGIISTEPEFTITPTSKDFGTVLTGQNATQTFTITNTGGGDLVISNFALSGANANEFSQNGVNNTTITPSNTYEFTVTFVPTTAGAKETTLTITDNTATETHTVVLNGTAEVPAPQFSISPTTKDFGNVQINTSVTQIFTITNNGTDDLSLSSFALNGANSSEFSHNGTPQTIAPNENYEVTVTFSPTTEGNKTASLDITDNDGNHSVALNGAGVVTAPQFTVSPTSKNFGNVETDTSITQVFTITNTGTADLSISAFALSGANASEFSHNGTAQTIIPNGTYEVTVTFSPTSDGSKTASLDITDNNGNHFVALGGIATTCIVNIPDANFKTYLVDNTAINTNENNEIECSEAQAFSGTINCSSLNINDITGIEAFVNLNELICHSNPITSIDISQNASLTYIDCSNTNLTTLNLANSNNTDLVKVNATSNNSLSCIQHDVGYTPTNWEKDASANWSDDCNIPQFTITPTSKDFGDVVSSQTATQTFTITNTGTGDLSITSFSLSGTNASEFSHNGTAQTIAPNETYNVIVTFAPTNIGFKDATLTITNNTVLGNHSVGLNGNGTAPSFSINPTSKDFGNLLAGQTTTQVFTITNNGTADLSITSFSLSGANTSEFSHNGIAQTITPNGNYDITITFAPTSAGSKTASLEIADNDGDHTVVLNGTGIAPSFSINPTSKDFGNVIIEQTSTQVFTITNNGTADLSISNFDLSGANADEFSHNGTAQTIAPNETHDVTITFTPTSAGTKTASLDITDNDGNHTVALNGNGTCIVNIPDANFKSALLSHSPTIDTNGDGEIQCNEAEALQVGLSVANKNISNLTGVEAFINVNQIYCERNQLTSLDVSSNTKITNLFCYNNQLTSLNTSGLTSLSTINCKNNQLNNIDVSSNSSLTKLDCYQNNLTAVNVLNNTNLLELNCYENQLTELNVTQNTALTKLTSQKNQLTSINLSQNINLTILNCSENKLTSLDLSSNTNITTANCKKNVLTSLNLSGANSLVNLYCDDNQLTSLDISSNTNIEKLYCINNKLTSLNLANGNNSNLAQMKTFVNSTLSCIQIDAGFTPPSGTAWQKDNTASYSDACNTPLFTITPTSKDFGDVQVGQSATQQFTITNNGTADLVINSFAISGNNADEFSHNGTAQTIAPNATYQFTATFAPTSVEGKTASITITDNSGNHTVALTGNGTVPPAPQFAITPTSKDFGNVQIGQTATQIFTITNTGNADLVISAFALSGNFSSEFSHNGTAQTIPPNGTYDVTVTFSPTSAGTKTMNLINTGNTGNHTVALTGNGTINPTPQFAITPTSKDFSNVQVGQTATQQFTITNNGTADLVINSFAISGNNADEFSHNGTAQTIAPNATYLFTATFDPTSVGGKTASITITDNTGNHTIALTGNGTAPPAPQFAITPTSKDFGNVQIGQTATQIFTITNTGNADLVISAFALSGNFSSEFSHNGTAQTIPPNGTYDVTVTFSPTSAGTKTMNLINTGNTGNHTVVLTGNGTTNPTPQFAITPTSKDFSNVQVGQSATQQFTITNNGTADLVINSFTISGNNADEFSHNGTAQTIAPNSTYQFTATFAPTSVGGKNASITITDNAGNHTVALTGNGTTNPTPQFSITPISKNFGYVQVGQSAIQQFTITNNGTADLVINSFAISGNNADEFSHNGTAQTIAPNATYQFTATFAPTSVGGKSASIAITDNTGNHTVALTGAVPTPQFAITPTSKDFGNVQVGQTATQIFTITNTGNADLVISNFILSGNFSSEFSHNGTAQTIPPNGTYDVTVTFSPTSVGAKTMNLINTGNTGIHTVALTGNGTTAPTPEFAITPTSKDFGDIQVGQSVTQQFTITNNGTADLVINSFAISGNNADEFSHNGTAQTIAPNTTYQFTATFSPTSVGGKTASITITDNAGNHTLAVTGNATAPPAPQFSITPTSKDFGEVLKGESASQEFTITNTGNADLIINRFSLRHRKFTHNGTPQTIAPNASYKFTVTYSPTNIGMSQTTLRILDNAGNHSISLKGTGLAPIFSVTPTLKDFRDVQIGQTATQQFIITNSGNANLVISDINISGTNANEFNHDGTTQSIAPNTSYQFTGSFSPTSEGNKSSSITITDNAGNHTIPLTGNGITTPVPQFNITPINKDFDNVIVGQTANQQFTITNNGTADLVINSFAISGNNADEFSHNGTAQTIAPNTTYQFTATFAPTSVGGKSASIVITDNTGNHTVALTGNGIADNQQQQTITWTGDTRVEIGCDGNNSFIIDATTNSSLPLLYEIVNTSIATLEGNMVKFSQPGTTIVKVSQPGNTNYLAAQPVLKTITYKSNSLIQQHWDDTLFFDNSSNLYSSWQWYKNGNVIAGATQQYYYEDNPLSGSFYVIAQSSNGTIETCILSITASFTKNIIIAPNPVYPNDNFTVKSDFSNSDLSDSKLTIVTTSGQILYETTDVSSSTNITAPSASGMYIVSLQLNNGKNYSANLIVR